VKRRASSREAVYCAASWYDPGRFWSGDRIELVPPGALGGEIAVR
jgi:hypothetical protein